MADSTDSTFDDLGGGSGAEGGVLYSLRALKHRDFAVFWTGAFIGNTAGWFQSLAVPYVLYLITESAFWVGLAAAAQFVPGVVLGPIAGLLAERRPLRTTLAMTQGLRAVVCALMLIAWLSEFREPLLYVLLMAVYGVAQGLAMPSWHAFVHHISPRSALSSAVTLNTVQFNLSRSFGPALGGLVLLWWNPSVAFTFALVGTAGVMVSVLLVRGRQTTLPTARRRGVTREFIDAIGYVGSQPGLVLAFVITACVGILGMPVFQHVIVYSESVFNVGALGLTVLNLGLGLGTVLGVPLVSGFEHRVSRARLAALSMPAYGLALIAFGFAPDMVWGFGLLVIIGLLFLVSLSVGNNSIQMIVADRVRGRVLAMSTMMYAGSVAFGAWLQGLVTDLIGVRATVISAGAALVIAAVVLMLWRGRFRLARVDDPFDDEGVPSAH